MPMTSSAAVSLREATAAGSKAKGPPRRLRFGLRRARHRDDDLLALFDIAGGDFGRCAVGNTEPDPYGSRLLTAHNVNGAFTAAPAAALSLSSGAATIAAARSGRAAGVRPLRVVLPFAGRLRLRLIFRRTEAKRRVSDLQHALFAVYEKLHVRRHARLQQQLFVVDAYDGVVGDDVLDHDRRIPHLKHLALETARRIRVDGEFSI